MRLCLCHSAPTHCPRLEGILRRRHMIIKVPWDLLWGGLLRLCKLIPSMKNPARPMPWPLMSQHLRLGLP